MGSNSRFSYIFVAISFVSTALLYVYFKNKVDKVDEKLDMMYQLIQSHALENDARDHNFHMMHSAPGNVEHLNQPEITMEEAQQLIEVSENETEDSNEESGNDSDSDSESDSGSEADSDKLVLGESTDLDNVKKIELNLEQVDVDNAIEEDITLKKLSEISLEDVENVVEHNVDQASNNQVGNEDVESENVESENVESEDVESEDEDNDENNNSEEVVEEVKVESEVQEEIDYSKFKVTELKGFCRDRNLTNYAALKKKELIDLLMSS